MVKLTPIQVNVLDCLAEGMKDQDIAEQLQMTRSAVSLCLSHAAQRLGLPYERFTLAFSWSCELFQIGLKELGYL